MTIQGKPNLLFLCTGNSCRSQMAEGWAKHLLGETYNVYSAGIETHGLNPLAVRVMAEQGVPIDGHRSKHVDTLAGTGMDYVITVCDHAATSCPRYPATTRTLHRAFDDPPRLATAAGSEEERLAPYRRVCLEIRDFVRELPKILAG